MDRRQAQLRLWWLGMELRRLRAQSGLTGREIANRSGIDFSTITRWESGLTRPHRSTLSALLNAYGVAGEERARLIELTQRSKTHGWWQAHDDLLPPSYTTYIAFEAEASELRTYEPLLVPGLLQTEAYAAEVIRAGAVDMSDDDVRRRVEVRMQRQGLVWRDEDPVVLHALVDEAAIRRVVGGPKVMRDQLRALRSLPEHVTLRVVPFSAGAHSGMDGGFTLMRFRDPRAPVAVTVENMAGQLFLDDDVDLLRYTEAWRRLEEAALDRDASETLIADVAKRMR